MRIRTGRVTRTILVLAAALVLGSGLGQAATGLAQTEDQEDAGLTGRSRYESPEFGFRVAWHDPWEVADDSPTSDKGGPDELILLGEPRDEMRDQINFLGVSNDEPPADLLERLTEDRLDDEDTYPEVELVEERYDADPPTATITWLFEGDFIVQHTEIRVIEEDESVLVIDHFVPAEDFDDAFPAVSEAVTVDGDPLFAQEDGKESREDTGEGAEPVFRGGSDHTGVQPGPGPEGELAIAWSIELPVPDSGPAPRTSPVYADGTLFVVRSDGLHAIDAANGEELWAYEANAENGDTPTVADGTVYFTSYEGIFAVDAETGELRWQADGEGGGETAVVVADGRVHVNSDGYLVALDGETGEELWRAHNGAFKGRFCTPTVAGGVVFSGGQLQRDGANHPMLRALDAESGEELWILETAEPPCSPPAVSDGVVFAGGGEDGVLLAVDAESGDVLWENTRLPSNQSVVAVADNVIYVAYDGDTLTALDAATGDVSWEADLNGFVRYPVVVGDEVYVLAGPALIIFDAATGEVRAELDGLVETDVLGDAYIPSSPLVVDGFVYLTTDGGLIAVEGEP